MNRCFHFTSFFYKIDMNFVALKLLGKFLVASMIKCQKNLHQFCQNSLLTSFSIIVRSYACSKSQSLWPFIKTRCQANEAGFL